MCIRDSMYADLLMTFASRAFFELDYASSHHRHPSPLKAKENFKSASQLIQRAFSVQK